MSDSIPQNLVQCTFDFDALSDQPASDAVLPTTDNVPQQKQKYCKQCKLWLPATLDYWYRHKTTKSGFGSWCKSCQNTTRTVTYSHRREQGLCVKCFSPVSGQMSLCEQCNESLKQDRYSNSDALNVISKRCRNKLRDEVLASYGGSCAVCGESHVAFLTVDHINDDGARHRRSTGNGHRFYQWLRNNGFPAGYQTLCSNCNWRKYVSLQSGEKTYHQIWYANLRQEVITAYGSVCVCCGESHADVLTVDHVNTDGAQHRREIGHGGTNTYQWLRKNGFPQDGRFQLLCFNCNRARYFHGSCPHQS